MAEGNNLDDIRAIRRNLVPLDTIESQRNGQWFCGEGEYEGYFFRHDRTTQTTVYLKCVKRGCKGRAIVHIQAAQVEYTGQHQPIAEHNPNNQTKDEILAQIQFAREVLQLSKESCEALRIIYDNVAQRFPVEVTSRIQFLEIRNAMIKRRYRSHPRIPNNIAELANIMTDNEAPDWCKTCQGEHFIIRERHDGLIIISPRTKELLKENVMFSVDGTFKVAPRKPKIYQVYTVGAIFHGIFIPIAFGLLQNKTADIYEWMFREIRTVTEPNWNPFLIKMDFETGAIAALKEVFGQGCALSGCWFHFTQAIQRKCGLLGLIVPLREIPELRRIIKKIMALALLPAARIEEGFHVISTQAEQFILGNLDPHQDVGLINNILQLLQYVEEYWIGQIGPNMLSVYDSDTRTNNHHEAFNSNIGAHITNGVKMSKPNVWRFIHALRKIENDAAIKYTRLRIDPQCNLRYPKNKIWQQQDNNIVQSQAFLFAGIYNVQQFLERAKYFCNFVQVDQAAHAEDAIEPNDGVLVEDQEDIQNLLQEALELNIENEDAYIQQMILEEEENEDHW